MTAPPPTPRSPENTPATVPMAASFRVLPRATARHTRSRESRTARAEQRLRRPRRRARPTACQPLPFGRPAGHRRDARPDRAPRRRRPRPREDAHGADRPRKDVRRGGVHQRARCGGRAARGLARLDRLRGQPRRRAAAAGRDQARGRARDGALDQARAGVRRAHERRGARPAAGAHRGQGGDRGLALARGARRGGRARGGQAHRRAGRGGRARAPLGAQGARGPPARARRQGRCRAATAARRRCGRRALRRRRHHRPRRLPGPDRARRVGAASRPPSASACGPTRGRPRSPRRPTWWSTPATACGPCSRRCSTTRPCGSPTSSARPS